MGGGDYVSGGKGDDRLHAYFSADVEGTDISSGKEGDDNVLGGYGADWTDGGKGGDVLRDQSGCGRPVDVNFVDGGSGANPTDVFGGEPPTWFATAASYGATPSIA
jgi:RTX calcium-binding nonapeptide repeat (4 copies)